MVAKGAGSFSPSAEKPEHVVKSWGRLNVPIRIIEPVPVSRQQLYAAHDSEYVNGILNCTVPNGFGNKSKLVADSLIWTNGSLLSAAREALKNGAVAVAPTSGFHHAHYSFGGGFCTFNGLMVTAAALLGEAAVRSVGIIDLDHHYGDGTYDIIHELGLQDRVLHFSAGEKWRRPEQAAAFLKILPEIVESFAACDLLLVQLGADPHIHDPLGGWLTTSQLKQRDSSVFKVAKAIGVPVAWTLAGGYQQPLSKVIRLHDNSLLECGRVWCR